MARGPRGDASRYGNDPGGEAVNRGASEWPPRAAAVASVGPRPLLEKRGTEQFKPDVDSCLSHVLFRRAQDGAMAPFRCGSWSCPACGPAKAQSVRWGVYRACRDLGLGDMVTLTLPVGARGSTPTESRTALSVMFNAFKSALRKRGVLGEYVAVPEYHKDGSAHLHLAANLDALVLAAGGVGEAQAILSEAWGRLGGGFVWLGRGRRGVAAKDAAAYLSKYLGKAQGQRAPWEDVRYCTADGNFRVRPWRRYWVSRAAGALVKGPPRVSAGEWALVRPETLPSGRVRYEPWNPAKGSAIMQACDGHPAVPEWVPGSCHHGGGPLSTLGQCFCVPPWAYEPVWRETLIDLANAADLALLSKARRRDLRDVRRPSSISQEAVDWALESEAGELAGLPSAEAGPWWSGGTAG